ncbi:globin domain-containing protein [Aquabacterium humicola]|uniref:globin domain-containing protein n=1 Tax=Aquabacterium humicola TaxID=3237377 RepID=UPI002543AAF1|nr:globin domain-containing protein [Rubrivivax pictus]
MTPHEIRLVRKSFELVRPISCQVAALFVDKLVERDAELAGRLSDELGDQGDRLVALLDHILAHLDRPAELATRLHAKGCRIGPGISDAQHRVVGAVLIDTLAAAIGVVFTPAVRGAWASLVRDVSTALRAGAAETLAMAEAA